MEAANEYIKQAELARRTGFSRAYINKLVKQGKISVNDNGLIDVVLAMRELEASKDYNREGQRSWGEKQRAAGTNSRPDGNDRDFLDDETNPEFGNPDAQKPAEIGLETQKSNLVKLTMEAKLKYLQYLREKGELISIEEVAAANARIAATIRTNLLSLGQKMAPGLEGKTAAEIQYAIDDAVNDILAELYRMAGGE